MFEDTIEIKQMPELKDPLFIAGFDGWGNALDVSRGMADYMIRKLKAKFFGRINSDIFYRFDENRPLVNIENGLLKEISPPRGRFFATERGSAGRDIIIFKATEPNLRWFQFVGAILALCRKAGVKTIICLGSMYDNVLHTDNIISALASSEEILSKLKKKKLLQSTIKDPAPYTLHSSQVPKNRVSNALTCGVIAPITFRGQPTLGSCPIWVHCWRLWENLTWIQQNLK